MRNATGQNEDGGESKIDIEPERSKRMVALAFSFEQDGYDDGGGPNRASQGGIYHVKHDEEEEKRQTYREQAAVDGQIGFCLLPIGGSLRDLERVEGDGSGSGGAAAFGAPALRQDGRDKDERGEHDQVGRQHFAHEVARLQAPRLGFDDVRRIAPARGKSAEVARH